MSQDESGSLAQGFIVAAEDEQSQRWAKWYIAKFGKQTKEASCQFLRMSFLVAIAELGLDCWRFELVMNSYPVGHKNEELIKYVRNNFPNVRITHIPRNIFADYN